MDERITTSIQGGDGWERNEMTVVGELEAMVAHVAVYKVAAFIPVTREMLDDAPVVSDAVRVMLDRRLRPWRYADPPVHWTMRLFPRPIEWILDKCDNRG